MRSLFQTHLISSLQRIGYTGTAGSYGTVYVNIHGYLRPMTQEQANLNNYQWATAFNLIVDNVVDIQAGDRVVINDITYNVRGVQNHDRGREPYKRAAVTMTES